MVLSLALLCYFGYFLIDINTKLWLSGNLIDTPSLYLLGVLPCGQILGLTTIVLGIWALFQKGYKKLLPGIGIFLGFINLLIVPGLFLRLCYTLAVNICLAPQPVHSKIGYFLIGSKTKLWLTNNFIDPPSLYIFGLLPLGLILGLASFILGICALFQKGYKKLLPDIGILLAVINFVAIVGLFFTVLFYMM